MPEGARLLRDEVPQSVGLVAQRHHYAGACKATTKWWVLTVFLNLLCMGLFGIYLSCFKVHIAIWAIPAETAGNGKDNV